MSIIGTPICFLLLVKRHNVCDLYWLPCERGGGGGVARPKRVLLLKKGICSEGSNFFPFRVNPNWEEWQKM